MCRQYGDYRVVAVYEPRTGRFATVRPIPDDYGHWTGRCLVRCDGREAVENGWDEAVSLGYRMAARQ